MCHKHDEKVSKASHVIIPLENDVVIQKML